MYLVNIIFCKKCNFNSSFDEAIAHISPLLPATSYPKTDGGICYAIIKITPIGLKQALVTSQP